jgi:hypothetical protein
VKALEEPIKSIISNVLGGLDDESEWQRERTQSFYGFGDTAKKQLKELAGGEAEKPEKKKPAEEQRGLKQHAKDSVDKFEQAAKGLKKISEGVSSEKDEEAFVDSAASLVKHLEGTDLGKGPMKEMLQSANRAIAGYDAKKLGEILFSFKGVKNFMHMYLRELKERKHKDDDYFGNVDDALAEFEKLGQI